MPFFKAMVMEPTPTLFALFPCILLADTAFALSAQVGLVVIHSIASHIYVNTTACWKYSAAGSATLRSRLHVLFQIYLNNLPPKRQQVKGRIFRFLFSRYKSQQFYTIMSGIQTCLVSNNTHHHFLLLMEMR